jgi:tetratricopeptide (TPR) repeat protein
LAYLRLGEAHDRLGDRAAAVEAYQTAQTSAPAVDRLNVRSEARDRLRRAPDSTRSEAYRLSLDGWRRLERNDLPGARFALERSVELNGGDPVARYRFGRVLEARKDDPGALAQLELAIRGAAACPPSVLGSAYLEAARLHERAGRRDQAITYYRVASSLFGAALETHTAAARALTRLRAK